ncbi:hypothetical protein GCM10009864_74830 [Streptomyces lunalinharesii]|uniref:Uncharacterized protein n=1 Tax=Streptomyces lunalinharesii TaxID=333384 RepID=A0ABN3SZN5_9ACTN
MRSRVLSDTRPEPPSALEAVLLDTPAARATSIRVTERLVTARSLDAALHRPPTPVVRTLAGTFQHCLGWTCWNVPAPAVDLCTDRCGRKLPGRTDRPDVRRFRPARPTPQEAPA